ncbi:MAG: SIR2 family protein [Bacteroidetes bacterium]|nr:SIR2 family protein [Bacteroidota bacterium]
MKTATIEELGYIIKQAKKNNQNKPIFFLGAGASKTGDIPLAKDIIADILEKYADAPAIKKLKEDEISYSKLMECLQPNERDVLLKGYIDKAKINVTHIYLAQLIKNDFVDYVLTVNFDNLMLRALALFNEFPSTYDMAILNDIPTTAFNKKSVVYLHGQHHGLWLLNTEDEMDKVKNTVPSIFDSIKNKRPWVFIGYSGDDPIFDHVKNIARFDNGLYWVTYKDNDPSKRVQDFLKTRNKNAFIIKGFDSDAFMLKLNNELELEQPEIIGKPFTSIKEMLNNIVDINDDEHFKGVKERLEISKNQVETAIQQFEKGKVESTKNIKKSSEVDLLKKEIIDLLVKEDYENENIERIENVATQLNNNEINSLLADLFFNWGTDLGKLAETKEENEKDQLYHQAFEKFQRAVEIKPDYHDAFFNWGTDLGNLADTKEGKEKDQLYHQAFEKFQRAVEIKPDMHKAFSNWGTDLGNLAETKEGKEKEQLYHQAFEKYQRAVELGGEVYNLSCGYALKKDKENALFYLNMSLEKKEITVDFVNEDTDWNYFKDDLDFKELLKRFSNGKE